MKGANKLFIFTGVALALVAVLIGITMSSGGNKTDAQVDESSDKVKVVKALVDLEPYTVISMADVEVVEMKVDEAPAGAATSIASVVSQSYTIRAVKGEVLLSSFLQAPGITASIEPGKRAFSLEANTRGMMSGLITEGDYVDVVFDARIDINRVLSVQGIEVMEDGDYTIEFKDDDENDDSQGDEEGNNDESNDDESNEGEIIPGTEAAEYQGKPGTEFTITDAGAHLEPATKILVQDVKVLRVIQPGVEFDSQGQQVQDVDGTAPTSETFGQLILEVTPQQAEALSFMQNNPDDQYTYHYMEVIVRAKDDHEVASTSGITFQILATDEDYLLPVPQPVAAPEGTEPEE